MSKLFREQAVAAQRERLHGEVLLVPRPSHTYMIAGLVLWAASVGLWLCLASYSRHETVSGWLEPPGGVIRIFADGDAGAIIDEVYVEDGDMVREGQSLFAINGDRYAVTGNPVNRNLEAELDRQRDLAEREITRIRNEYEQRAVILKSQMQSAQLQISATNAQLSSSEAQFRLAQAHTGKLRKLQIEGVLSSRDVENATSEELALSSNVEELKRDQIEYMSRVEGLIGSLNMVPTERDRAISLALAKVSDIKRQREVLSAESRRVIRAPRDGIVMNVRARAGASILGTKDGPQLSLLPVDKSLIVQLLIPVRAAGFLSAGQQVRLRYDAFPYQKFGTYSATITHYSRSIVLPSELTESPLVPREPVYLATAKLRQASVRAFGKVLALKPGMTLSADIELERRRVGQWLLEPINAVRGSL